MSPVPPPPLPSPTALRLHRGEPTRTRPLLGLAGWSDDPSVSVAVLLDRPASGASPTLDEVVDQLPSPSTLAAGTLVIVLGDAAPSGALLGRWLGGRVRIPRHVRSSALLALGYTRLGGGVDPKGRGDLAWGYVG